MINIKKLLIIIAVYDILMDGTTRVLETCQIWEECV